MLLSEPSSNCTGAALQRIAAAQATEASLSGVWSLTSQPPGPPALNPTALGWGLAVDDDKDIADSLALLLETLGAEVALPKAGSKRYAAKSNLADDEAMSRFNAARWRVALQRAA